MILVVRQALVNLSARQVGKAPHDIVDAGTVNDQSTHIMHSDSSAIYNRVASAHVWRID
jgi:hypothetical protein